MRRNLTISFDPEFIEHLDADRGSLSRGKFIEALLPAHDATILRPSGEKTSRGLEVLEPVGRGVAAMSRAISADTPNLKHDRAQPHRLHRPTCRCSVCKPPKAHT
jgi:hypothetical protein